MNPLLLGPLFELGGKLLDKFFPDPAAKAAAQVELLRMQQTGELAELAATTDLAKLQIQTNLEEAKSESVFVAGWRPFCGWTGGIALAYASVLEPLLRFSAKVGFGYGGDFPVIDTMLTLQILMGMLGLAGLRTYDKKVGNGSEKGKM